MRYVLPALVLHDVDAVAEAVVRAQFRDAAIGDASARLPLGTARQRAETGERLVKPLAAAGVHRLAQGHIFVRIVVAQRLRLVGNVVGRVGWSVASFACLCATPTGKRTRVAQYSNTDLGNTSSIGFVVRG